MKPLILDTEEKWLAHWQAQNVPAVTTLAEALPIIAAQRIDTVLLNSRLMCLIPGLIVTGVKIIIVTSLLLTAEAIAAYRASGHSHAVTDYIIMDFNLTPGKLARQVGRVSQ